MSKKKVNKPSIESDRHPLDSLDYKFYEDYEDEGGFSKDYENDSEGASGSSSGSGSSSVNAGSEIKLESVMSFVSECVIKDDLQGLKITPKDPNDRNFGVNFYKQNNIKVDDLPERTPSIRELLPILQMADRDKKKKTLIVGRKMSPSPTYVDNQRIESPGLPPKQDHFRKRSPLPDREFFDTRNKHSASSPRKFTVANPSSPKNLNQNPYIIRNYMERVNNLYKRQEELSEFQMRKNKAKEYSFKERSPPRLLDSGDRSMKLNLEEKGGLTQNKLPASTKPYGINPNRMLESEVSFIKATVAKYLNGNGGIALEQPSTKQLDSPTKMGFSTSKREIPPVKLRK